MTSQTGNLAHAEARQQGWREWGFVWLLWVWANVLGLGAGLFIGRLFSGPTANLSVMFQTSLLGGIITGTTVGFAQWLVLRGQLPRLGVWVQLSTLGWTVGWELGWAIQDRVDGVAGWVAGWSIIGLVAGLAQWFVLRRSLRGAGWWVLASTLGGAAGGALGGYFFSLAFEFIAVVGASSTVMTLTTVGIVMGVGLAYGIVSGGVLAWLLRNTSLLPMATQKADREKGE